MIFSSLFFLYAFLPFFLIFYYITPEKHRNKTALAGSLLFYSWGAPKFVLVLIISSISDYYLSQIICKTSEYSHKKRKSALIFALVINLSVFLYFKYANFFVGEFNSLLSLFKLDSIIWKEIALPIGISFFTFQKISFLIDVYRGNALKASSVFDYILYVALFPQLIAGPIVRYHDVDKQLKQRNHNTELFFSGVWRFCQGLGKKVLLANTLALTADKVFALDYSTIPSTAAWLGLLCYAFQIYFDFSGYSDMAIGLGRMMGFKFLENFNRPYISNSFTEFWRRWHISLSNWMREYLYIPLGGNRTSKARSYLNLWLVFLLSGFWHGASWNFVFWGGYHGFFLSLDKLLKAKTNSSNRSVYKQLLTFFLVIIGWVFFRAVDLNSSFSFLKSLFSFSSRESLQFNFSEIISNRGYFCLLISPLFAMIPLSASKEQFFAEMRGSTITYLNKITIFIISVLILFLSSCALANSGYNPFIYFRF